MFPSPFFDLQIKKFFTLSVFNLQDLEAKILSTDLYEFLKIIVDSTINIRSNQQSTFTSPPQAFTLECEMPLISWVQDGGKFNREGLVLHYVICEDNIESKSLILNV